MLHSGDQRRSLPDLSGGGTTSVAPEQHADGISLLPLLRGAKNIAREALFWHYPHYSNQGGAPAAVVLCGHWKLIRHFENEQYELFDLINDPSEQSDLSALSPHAERVRRMRNLLQQWLQETFAKLPQPNPMACPALDPRREVENA